MSNGITLYTNPFSRGRIAHWMLEEVGVPYRVELLDFEHKEHKRPEYLALNPMGKVPTLVHEGTVVTEAAAICAYLADAFPAAGLAPALDDRARGPYLRALFFAAGCIEPALSDKMLNRPVPDRPSAIGYGTYEDVLATIEKLITPGPFVLGERFSAADVYLGSEIGWGMLTKSLEARPAFGAYVSRQARRPAFERFQQKCKELEEALKARR
jgi:glutathione S-transferase